MTHSQRLCKIHLVVFVLLQLVMVWWTTAEARRPLAAQHTLDAAHARLDTADRARDRAHDDETEVSR